MGAQAHGFQTEFKLLPVAVGKHAETSQQVQVGLSIMHQPLQTQARLSSSQARGLNGKHAETLQQVQVSLRIMQQPQQTQARLSGSQARVLNGKPCNGGKEMAYTRTTSTVCAFLTTGSPAIE